MKFQTLKFTGIFVFLAVPAFAQQPTMAEIADAMNTKIVALQNNLDQAYLTLARQKVDADSHLKWVLDNWVPKSTAVSEK